ncbi:hypothetical protein F4680DRAFT_470125 [Xylaria scruposa]|nr:hypothetical protein F4680DRAFT_470125 [Xylaria scruposa]
MILALDFLKDQVQDGGYMRKLTTAGTPVVTTTTTVTVTKAQATTIRTSTVTITQTTAQPTAHTTKFPEESLPDCDFYMLKMGARALKPPLDVANSINLAQWKVAWNQLNEIRVLINLHHPSLIHQYGDEVFESFRSDLETLVEMPLRYGCSTLHCLQNGLHQFRNITHDQDDGARANLSSLLRETEIGIINHGLKTTITHLLPSWARYARELRSGRCPGEDCFKIGETALDIAMFEIPIELLNGVRRVQFDTTIGGNHATQRTRSPAFRFMPLRFTTAPMSDILVTNNNSQQWITDVTLLGAALLFGVPLLFSLSGRRIGVPRLRLLSSIGLALVLFAVFWRYAGSLIIGAFERL